MGHVGKLLVATAILAATAAYAQDASQSISTPVPPAESQTHQASRLATVIADRVYARCGPSTSYYPTAILRKGDRVKVVQIRPDGWAAIEPPEGAFCWVSGEFVRMVEPGIGEATEDGVWVWIGSNVSPRRDHSQVRLKKGQRVRVLKSSVFAEDALQRVWLQIEPPEGEVRWVKAEYLRFTDDAAANQVGTDTPPPPADPQVANTLEASRAQELTETPDGEETRDDADEAFARTLFEQAEAQFRDTMQRPVGHREILPLKAKYQQVLRLTANPALRKVVQTRLAILEQEEIRERYARKFLQLLERSRARDRELLQLAKRSTPPPTTGSTAAPAPSISSPSASATPPPSAADAGAFDRWFDDPFSFTPGNQMAAQRSLPPRYGDARRPMAGAANDRVGTGMTPVPPTPAGGAAPVVSSQQGRPIAVPAPGSRAVANRANLPPGYGVLVGVLHPVGTTPGGRRRYVVRDPRSGRAIGYVVEAPGLRLEPYVGKLTQIVGRVLSPVPGSGSEVLARRVEPIVR